MTTEDTKMTCLKKLTACMVLLFGSVFANSQIVDSPNFSASETHEFDTIDLATLVPNFRFPVVERAGAIHFDLSISSPQSCYINSSGNWACGQPGTNGLLAPFERVLGAGIWGTTAALYQTYANGCQYNHVSGLISPNGIGYHPIPAVTITTSGACGGPATATVTTTDGSYITATLNQVGGNVGVSVTNVQLPNGFTTPTATSVSDTNGNTITQNSSTYTDTLNNSSVGFSSTSYSWLGPNSTNEQITLTSGSNLTFLPYNAGVCGTGTNTQTATPITSINYPDSTSIGITWDANPNQSGTSSGLIGSITLRTGATISYTYTPATPNCTTPLWKYSQITRTTPDGTTRYSVSGNVTTVLDPGNNKTTYQFVWANPGCSGTYCINQPVVTQVQHYQNTGTVSSPVYTLLTTDVYCYNNNQTNCPTTAPTFPISQRDTYHTIAGMSSSSRVSEHFDSYGNTTSVAKYDFGASSYTVIKNIAYGTYNGSSCVGIGNHIIDHPCNIWTSDGTNTLTNTTYSYDSHGNLQNENVWSGATNIWTSKSFTYNPNGTVNVATDFGGGQTSYTYTNGCNNMFPTQNQTTVASGDVLTSSKTWDCNGPAVLTATDVNGKQTTYGYDEFWRQTSVTRPDGQVITTVYPYPTEVQEIMNFGSSTVTTQTFMDSLGRTIIKNHPKAPGSNSYDVVSQTYGFNGTNWQTQVSEPCVTGNNDFCPNPVTTLSDPLRRPMSTTDPLGGTVNYSYNQNDMSVTSGPTPSGENPKTVQTEVDGLGRPKSTCALQVTGGTSCGQVDGHSGILTTNTYTTANGSTTAKATRGSQTRTYVRDARGRLVSETQPELGTTTYIYDSTDSRCGTPTWSSAGDLMEKVDNAGNVTCYGYDSLHRVTGYGVAGQTPCPNFVYGDNSYTPPSGVTINNGKGRLVRAYTSSDCAGTVAVDEWFSYDALGRITDMWESTPNDGGGYYHTTASYFPNGSLNTISIPNWGTTTYGVDGEGRIVTAQDGTQKVVCDASCSTTNSTTFDAAGHPLTVNIGGTGDSDNYAYDVVGHMTNWTFTVGSTPKSQTGTLTWNPNGTLSKLVIGDGFNAGGAQTCKFGDPSSNVAGYDDLARLISANCGSGMTQTFSYDQYDNLTQSGSFTWSPGYSASNNRYSQIGATYDNDGNVTYDSFNTYTWNGFGMMSSANASNGAAVCGTSGVCITYDAFNRPAEINNAGTYNQILYGPTGKIAVMSGQSTARAYIPLPAGATEGRVSGGHGFMHKDWLGTTRLDSSITGRSVTYDRAYAPYSEEYDNFGSTTLQDFTGDKQDIFTGLFDTPNRELAQNQGRWLSPDPARAGWNLYAYPTDPNTHVDPSGAMAWISCGWNDNGFHGLPSTMCPYPGPHERIWNDTETLDSHCIVDGLETPCGLLSLRGGGVIICPSNECTRMGPNGMQYFWASTNGPGSYYSYTGPGALYYSVEQAGIAAVQYSNPLSIKQNKEYSGNLYLDQNDVFSFTTPTSSGDVAASPFDPSNIPAGTIYAGSYHDHGAFLQASDENFSPQGCNGGQLCDLGIANSAALNGGNPMFLGTPSGRVEVYYPGQAASRPFGCVLVGSAVAEGPGVQGVPTCH